MYDLSPRARHRPLRRAPWLAIPLILAACGGSDDPASPSDDDEQTPDEQTLDGWTLVWQDEFDGNALDATRWSVQTGDGCAVNLCGWGNNELQWYQAGNATVGNGMLTITARRENAGGRGYSSARLRTLRKGDWRFARVDARARLPTGQGYWPAIWMLPTDEVYGTWAASGEIDIMELVGHEPNRVHGTLHYGGTSPANQSTGDAYQLPSGTFADAFHVFSVEWDEGEIRWYVDGRLYQTQTSWFSTAAPFPAPFNQRFHLIVNVAVGGNWPGNPDGSTVFPQSMDIDWIRVYQRSP
ncbi:MAG: glycoside hydrolase family 16 protein [Gemmatimonadetes bacterium]|nr:glycoside hydrolase family 16 protein [Gemmatimonadota bacterium]